MAKSKSKSKTSAKPKAKAKPRAKAKAKPGVKAKAKPTVKAKAKPSIKAVKPMTVNQVAKRLVTLCRKGDFETCYKELFSPNVISEEPVGSMVRLTKGMNGIKKKGEMWNASLEKFHGSTISNPVVCGNHFSLGMTIDVTFKGGRRQKMEEICVYEVKNGKVVKEQFFY